MRIPEWRTRRWGRSPNAFFSRLIPRLTRSIVPRCVWSAPRSGKAFLDASCSRAGDEIGDRQRLLIFGGSQGAKALNSAVIEGLPEL